MQHKLILISLLNLIGAFLLLLFCTDVNSYSEQLKWFISLLFLSVLVLLGSIITGVAGWIVNKIKRVLK